MLPREVLDGRPTQGSDQYGLTVTYAELRTGALPFEESGLRAVLVMLIGREG
jgi:hypothetical protein